MKKVSQRSIVDLIVEEKRKTSSEFLDEIDKLLNWGEIEEEISKYYKKGESNTGRKAYDCIVLLKMSLLETWYGLSDYEVEEQVKDRISFSKFVGISLEDSVPDHSVISRFRTALTESKSYEKILDVINKQLEKKEIIVKKGVLVDASIIPTPRKPRGKKIFAVVEDRKEDEILEETNLKLLEEIKPNVDKEARWIKKGKKFVYGYKKHVLTDEEGLILSVETTPANESDTKNLEKLLNKTKLEKNTRLMADKGYASEENRNLLKSKDLKNGIMEKAQKNKPLNNHQQLKNKLISKVRYKIERTFGSIKLWFKTGIARYVGLAKMHTQNIMEAIAYNLYRSTGISVSK